MAVGSAGGARARREPPLTDETRSRDRRPAPFAGPGAEASRPQHWSERLAGRLAVHIESDRKAVRVELDGTPFLRVDENLQSRLIGATAWLGPEEEAEIRAGPGLITALALRDRWCLHASAVAYAGEAVLFVGDSGAGKSTLAREIAAACRGWSRLTDDLTPVELSGGRLTVRPDFPQLKLAPEERWTGDPSVSIPVRELYLLRPIPAGEVLFHELSAQTAMLALLSHTAAARLFDDRLLERHLEFAATAATRAGAFRVDYPHRPGTPAEVAALSARNRRRECIADDA